MHDLLNKKLLNTPASPIRVMFEQILALEAQGEEIIRLDIGSPGFSAPSKILENSSKYLQNHNYQYSSNWGDLSLRKELSKWVTKGSGFNFNPANEVIITNGASEAVAMLIYSLLDNDQEFLIPTPAWPHYIACCSLFDKKYVELHTTVENNFKLTPDALRDAITKNTKALVLNTPCNPTGSVYSEQEFRDISKICNDKGIILILDEIYQNLNFEYSHSLLRSIEPTENLIYVSGFSKCFAMTGFRVGYLMAHESIAKEMLKYHQYTNVCGQEFVQKACADFLQNPIQVNKYLRSTRKRLEECNNVVVNFNKKHKLTMAAPRGAFYAFIEIPANFESAKKFCATVLQEQKISLIPGNGFGSSYNRYYRVSYGSTTPECLALALNKIVLYYK